MAKSKPKKSFLSTPSARRATREEVDGEEPENYFYPRPPRGGRPQDPESMTRWLCISIHALREEGDPPRQTLWGPLLYFYPRPPRGGRPLRHEQLCGRDQNFYPRPPRGGRPRSRHKAAGGVCISIHALREEGDVHRLTQSPKIRRFLSTPSARRATTAPRWYVFVRPHFYPRPPRGGRRIRGQAAGGRRRFLSTPSARRATALCTDPGGASP